MLTEQYYHLNRKGRLTAFEKSQPQIQPDCLIYSSSPQIHIPMDILYCPILIDPECKILYSSCSFSTFLRNIFITFSSFISFLHQLLFFIVCKQEAFENPQQDFLEDIKYYCKNKLHTVLEKAEIKTNTFLST